MKIWPFGRREVPEQKYSAAGPNIALPWLSTPVWTPRDYESLARESYLRNAISYRCVKLIASSASSVSWLLSGRGDKEIAQHPLLDLLDRPGPGIGGAAFIEALVAYYLLAGNSYVEAVGPDGRAPKELWALRPDRMQVIPGPYGLPKGYRYTVNGATKNWQANPLTGEGPILHMKDFHPVDDFYGMSRIEAAAYGIDRHNAASAHNKALLDNGARPSGALVFKPIKDGETITNAPQSMIDAASKRMNDTHGGPKNAGKPFVFNGDVDWLEMGITPKDMDFGESKNDAARDICTALGVPHILIVPGAATYNNVKEAKLELFEETVLPIMDAVTSAMNWWLCPRFGDDLRLDYDRDEIPALEPRRETKRASVTLLLEKGVITRGEARSAMQYGEDTETVVGKIDAVVLKALIEAIDTVGMAPLIRYMKSVGLFDPSKTEDQVLADAIAHAYVSEEYEDDALDAPKLPNQPIDDAE